MKTLLNIIVITVVTFSIANFWEPLNALSLSIIGLILLSYGQSFFIYDQSLKEWFKDEFLTSVFSSIFTVIVLGLIGGFIVRYLFNSGNTLFYILGIVVLAVAALIVIVLSLTAAMGYPACSHEASLNEKLYKSWLTTFTLPASVITAYIFLVAISFDWLF